MRHAVGARVASVDVHALTQELIIKVSHDIAECQRQHLRGGQALLAIDYLGSSRFANRATPVLSDDDCSEKMPSRLSHQLRSSLSLCGLPNSLVAFQLTGPVDDVRPQRLNLALNGPDITTLKDGHQILQGRTEKRQR